MQEDGGWHQMALVIRTHDPQGHLTGTGLLLILGVRVHERKHLGRWNLEQGPAPAGSLSTHPEPTSQRPQPREEKALAFVSFSPSPSFSLSPLPSPSLNKQNPIKLISCVYVHVPQHSCGGQRAISTL